MTDLPPEVTYGYVSDRIILAVGDGPDASSKPDAVAASGLITFIPAKKVVAIGGATPGRVLPQVVRASLDDEGYLVDLAGGRGVWLVAGAYTVKYTLSDLELPPHEIVVTEEHTEDSPLHLSLAMPPGGPVLTPSQYAALAARIDSLMQGFIPADEAAELAQAAAAPAVTAAQSAQADAAQSAIAAQLAIGAGDALANLVRIEKATLANPAASRPAWPGIVDWWVPVGSPAPPNAIAGDLVTEVSSEAAPWTPSTLPLGGWWSAAHPGTAPGGSITSVPDRSGNGRPAPVESGTVTHSDTALNGTPALVFGASSRLRTAVHALSGTGPLTFAWTGVLGSTSPSTARFFFGGRLDANANSTTQVGSNGSGNYTLRRVSTTSTTTVPVDANPHTYTAVFGTGSVSRLYIDGTLVHTGTSAAGSFDNLIIGGSTTTASGTDSQWYIGPGGMVGDLMWMTGALDNDNPADFATLQAWLKTRAGMS